MALPVTIPNTFANATSSIPLSQLDTNFSTLANAVNGLNSGSETLANLKATTANVGVLTVTGNATIGDASTDTVTLNSTLTANTAVIFAAGTSAAPSITTTGDLNTGIFFPAADTIAFAEGGAEAMRINSSGNVGIGTDSPSQRLHIAKNSGLGALIENTASTGATYVQVKNTAGSSFFGQDATGGYVLTDYAAPFLFYTNNTERMRIDSSGNVGIGVTPSAWSSVKALEIAGTGVFACAGTATNYSTNGYYDGAWKYKGTGNATNYVQTSGQHQFFTAASGTAGNAITFTQAMTLNASGGLQCLNTVGVGNATPSTSGAGITFPATQSASSNANTLDDYEEGTWTPTIASTGTQPTISSYLSRTGTYTKIGRLVYIYCNIRANISNAGTGDPAVTGFPFVNADVAAPTIALWDLFNTRPGYDSYTPFGYSEGASDVIFYGFTWKTGLNNYLFFTMVYSV